MTSARIHGVVAAGGLATGAGIGSIATPTHTTQVVQMSTDVRPALGVDLVGDIRIPWKRGIRWYEAASAIRAMMPKENT